MEEATLQFIAAQLRKPEGEEGIQMGARMNEGNRYINEHTIEALEARGNERLLEIGMGNGYFVNQILKGHPGLQYTGCDFSADMVRDARHRNQLAMQNGQAKFLVADAAELPFEDNSFDKVFAVNALYFWEEPEQTLAGIRRVLRPGGRLLIAIRPKELMQHMSFVKYGFRMYDAPDLEALLESAGFTVVQTISREEPSQTPTGADVKVATLIVIGESTAA